MYNHNSYNNYNNLNNNQKKYNSNTIVGSWENNNKKKPFSKFRNTYAFYDRINESTRIMAKYPDRIPIICEKGSAKDNPDIDKSKYIVPLDFTIGNFLIVIRKRIKLEDYEALFLMVDGSIPPTSSYFRDIYHKYKDEDGYLYLTYTKENVFG